MIISQKFVKLDVRLLQLVDSIETSIIFLKEKEKEKNAIALFRLWTKIREGLSYEKAKPIFDKHTKTLFEEKTWAPRVGAFFYIYSIHIQENMIQDKIIKNEILLQALSLKLSAIRHKDSEESEVKRLVQLRRDVYSGKVTDPLSEISKLY